MKEQKRTRLSGRCAGHSVGQSPARPCATRASRTVENSFRRLGFPRVAGVDEVGRGCLAGPVAAGAVVLDPRRPYPGLRDSKLLTAAARERLYRRHRARRARLGRRLAEPDEIDAINIHRASLRAMRGRSWR